MKSNLAANRYAKALLSYAIDNNQIEIVNNDIQKIELTFIKNDELNIFIKSRIINNRVKLNTIELIFKDCSLLTKRLFVLLYKNNRINLLDGISKNFLSLYNAFQGKQILVVTSAAPLDQGIKKEILDKVKKFTNKKITIENKIRKSIIGGFILRLGDIEYNASFQNKLNDIKQKFTNTNLSTL
ncbi:MAG: ATP synthase F1 subunit delta [Flavobacteriaceae bacterium]|nr:ATP synthase F1 subunit delta [Flavobacteriaceae bacterium]